MENSPKKKLWFKAKRYGWGWTPITWQGWLILAFFAGIIVLDAQWFTRAVNLYPANTNTYSIQFFGILILDVIALITICIKKGEKPGWRWGGDKTKK